MSDNVAGAGLAVRHLHALGHRRIATITGLLDTKPGVDRLRGYRDACAELGLAFRDEYVVQGDFYFDAGHEGARRLLALPEPPTAIFAASDMTAIGAVRGATEAGLRVPDDLSVVGFDDIQMAQHVHPPLTTVRQEKSGLGRAAGEALLRQIEGSTSTEPVTLGVELIVRGSTAAAPTTAARR
jgi:LacI family transcriptional regulator